MHLYIHPGVIAKVINFSLVVNAFEHQLGYYVHFMINKLGKGTFSTRRAYAINNPRRLV